jgi:hypothetical protein
MRICVNIIHTYMEVIAMPNFDGTGPLKRGRIIGRKMGTCTNRTDEKPCEDDTRGEPLLEEKPAA